MFRAPKGWVRSADRNLWIGVSERSSSNFSRGEPDPGVIAAVDAYIEGRQADLVEFVQELVRFGTVSIDLSPGSDHRRNEETGGNPTPLPSATTR